MPTKDEDTHTCQHLHETKLADRRNFERVNADIAAYEQQVSGDKASRLSVDSPSGIRINNLPPHVRPCKGVIEKYFGKLDPINLFPFKQISCLQITISQLDIYLADKNLLRPHIYIATSESRLALAVKFCDRPAAQSSIDFIDNLIGQIAFSVRTVHTDSRKEFQGEFKNYLERRGIRHEFTTDPC